MGRYCILYVYVISHSQTKITTRRMENDLIWGNYDNKPAYYYTELKLIIQLETVIQPEDYTAKTHMHSKYKQANSSEKENRGHKKDGRCYTRIFGQVFMENIESIDLLLRTSA